MFKKTSQPEKDSIHTVLVDGRKVITPNLAKRILEETNYAGQRPVMQHHILLLAHIMETQRWRPGGQLRFCRYNGRLILTNGQHRMHAVIQSGIPQDFSIVIIDCANMTDVEEDYRSHDTATRKRSVAEVIATSEGITKSGLSKRFLTRLYGASRLLENDLRDVHYSHDPAQRDVETRLSIVDDWLHEACMYSDFIAAATASDKTHLLNNGVMAVALFTIRYQPEKAESFWRGVAENDGLRLGDPRKALLDDFHSRDKAASNLARVMPAITAWNAFFHGRAQRIIRVTKSSRIKLDGTPVGDK